ncbi:tetratricopeptide repeat protein [Brevibacillus borstelensis]|uniref:tetratricopeptide repeat protein n=1 Tax=Brevibacillus borstelensis TaxID=45462 RepID=UPI0030BE61CE
MAEERIHSDSEEIVERLVDSIEYHFDNDNYETVITEAKKLLAVEPDHFYALLQMGYSYLNLGRMDEARETAQYMLGLWPSHPRVFHFYGCVCRYSGDYSRAVESFKQAIELRPLAIIHYCELVETLYYSQTDSPSYRMYAYAFNPRKLYFRYFFVGESKKKMEEALKIAEQAIGIDPQNSRIHSITGHLYYALGKYEEAEKEYAIALELSPEDAEKLANYAFLLFTLGKREDGRSYLDQALSMDPDAREVHYVLSQFEQHEDQQDYYRFVSSTFEAWSQLYPDSLWHLEQLIRIKLQFDRKPMKELKKYLSIRPDDLEMQIAYGQLLFDKDKYKAALAHFQKIQRQFPGNAHIETWIQTVLDKGAFKIYVLPWITPFFQGLIYAIAIVYLLFLYIFRLLAKPFRRR